MKHITKKSFYKTIGEKIKGHISEKINNDNSFREKTFNNASSFRDRTFNLELDKEKKHNLMKAPAINLDVSAINLLNDMYCYEKLFKIYF